MLKRNLATTLMRVGLCKACVATTWFNDMMNPALTTYAQKVENSTESHCHDGRSLSPRGSASTGRTVQGRGRFFVHFRMHTQRVGVPTIRVVILKTNCTATLAMKE